MSDGYLIGVDVGGTFTDLIVADGAGRLICLAKAASRPQHPEQGVLRALERAADSMDLNVESLLESCTRFVHGTTVATNALLTREGAKVGLLTTVGFRDSLSFRRGFRENVWDHRAPNPPVLAPRYLRLPVKGRVGPGGDEMAPLDESDVRAAAKVFQEADVEAVAVCLFNAYLNRTHEERAGQILEELLPEVSVILSSRVAPIMGEYERSSTAAVNAFIAPRTTKYLTALEETLRGLGYGGPFLLVQSNGGMATVAHCRLLPAALVLSGPAAGSAAGRIYAVACNAPDAVFFDMGGTSCDVTLLRGGRPGMVDQSAVGGYHVNLPSVEVHTIGTGGGTIAWVDKAGGLRMGPQSAGAEPGPASYGKGGDQPTVTDAHLLLGRLDPKGLLDGELPLSTERAEEAFGQIAEPLGMEALEAAAGAIRIANRQMAGAVQTICARHGADPRKMALVAGGGAGGLSASAVARICGMSKVIVPREAAAACAVGMVGNAVRYDRLKSRTLRLEEIDAAGLNSELGGLHEEIRAEIAEAGSDPADFAFTPAIDMRYPGQAWHLTLEVDPKLNGIEPGAVANGFHALHEETYGHHRPGEPVEITGFRIRAEGPQEGLVLEPSPAGDAAPAPIAHRRVFFEKTGDWHEATVYRGADLGADARIEGPAVIEEPTTTVLVEPGDALTMGPGGVFLIILDQLRSSGSEEQDNALENQRVVRRSSDLSPSKEARSTEDQYNQYLAGDSADTQTAPGEKPSAKAPLFSPKGENAASGKSEEDRGVTGSLEEDPGVPGKGAGVREGSGIFDMDRGDSGEDQETREVSEKLEEDPGTSGNVADNRGDSETFGADCEGSDQFGGRPGKSRQKNADPVSLAILQQRLDVIAREMGIIMQRTARSTIFSQAHDFSCFITDAAGRLVSQADGLPIHTGSGGFAVRGVLKDFGNTIAPGDLFLLNDPYMGGGNHLPDWTVIAPVFEEDIEQDVKAGASPCGFVCNRAHQVDVGGGVIGTYNSDATEIFHEGFRITPVRIHERGKIREDLIRLILANTRAPEVIQHDFAAMIGSTHIGAARLAEILEEMGPAALHAGFEGILDHAEALMRAALAQLPDGTYTATETMNTDCFEEVEVPIRLTLTKKGTDLTADFTGTAPQIKGYKNSPIANTCSALYLALSSMVDPLIPHNEGTYRPVRLIAPEGSVVNASFPAPVTLCTVFPSHEIAQCVWKALAAAAPDRVSAAWGKTAYPVTAGYDARGEFFVVYHWGGGPATGAVQGRDGLDLTGNMPTLGALTVPNLEHYEQDYPVRFVRQAIRTDGGGPGRWRGGASVIYEVEFLAPVSCSTRSESVRTVTTWGLMGGGPGAIARVCFRPEGASEFEDLPQYANIDLPPGTLLIDGPGGGGYGDPKDRPPDLVAEDVRDGYVSAEAAKRDYGVVVDPVTFEVKDKLSP